MPKLFNCFDSNWGDDKFAMLFKVISFGKAQMKLQINIFCYVTHFLWMKLPTQLSHLHEIDFKAHKKVIPSATSRFIIDVLWVRFWLEIFPANTV